MKPVELATIRSTDELVVHLDRFPRQVTVLDLSTMLCVPAHAILDSISHPANVEFAHALYEDLNTTQWKGSLVDAEGFMIPLPDTTNLLQHPEALDEDVLYFLSLGARFGHTDPVHWLLPKQEFITSKDSYPAPSENHILTSYQGKQACLKTYENSATDEVLDLLRRKVENLEDKLQSAAERLAEHRLHLGLLQNSTRMLEFIERDQRNRGFTAADYHQSVRRVREVRHQFERLELRLADRLINPWDVGAAGNELLALLRPGSSEYASFQDTFREILQRPFRVQPMVLHELLELVERALGALAASPVAETFVEEHLCDLLESTCDRLPESTERLFDDIADTTVGATALTGWRTAFADIRQELAIQGPPSLLTLLVKGGSIGKHSVSIVTAALNERTIGRILEALIVRAESRKIGGEKLAGVLLRYLTFTAVQARLTSQRAFPPPGAVGKELLLAGKHATLPRVKTILADQTLSNSRRVKYLKELELDAGVLRTPKAIGAMIAINVMALAVLLEDEDVPLASKIVETVALTGSLAASALKAEEYIYVRKTFEGKETPAVKRRWNTQKGLGLGVAALGLALSVLAFGRSYKRGDRSGIYLGVADTIGSGIRTLAGALSYTRYLAFAPALNIVGGAIGIAVIIAAVVHSILSRSPLELLKSYLDRIEGETDVAFDESSFVNQNAASIIADVRTSLKAAEQDDRTLGPFKFERGSPDNLKVFEGRLTVNKAILLDFTKYEITAMFGVSVPTIEPYFTGPNHHPRATD